MADITQDPDRIKRDFLRELEEKVAVAYEFKQFMVMVRTNVFVPLHLLTPVGARCMAVARALEFIDTVVEKDQGEDVELIILTVLGKSVMNSVGDMWQMDIVDELNAGGDIDMIAHGQEGYDEYGNQLPIKDTP
jgi:hypothetical protein